MRLPIKLNAAHLPAGLRPLLRSMEDPRLLLRADTDGDVFARAVSTLKFGRTFKSTARRRFPDTLAQLGRLRFATPPVVLDVGASDGSTSLDVMQVVDFRKYYCTDLNIEAAVTERGSWTYFHVPGGEPVLAACDRWIAYNDAADAPSPLAGICRRVFARAPRADEGSRRILLVNPRLRSRLGAQVEFRRYDALEPWSGEPPDLVIAANLLNRSYFTDAELERVLKQLRTALAPAAWVALIENRREERASLIQVNGAQVRVGARVGEGAELEALAVRALSAGAHG